ncbi:phage virion morphogenesis protein [Variovorax guangxiensis]|uniref:Phage virion morphogenesis protein n=1 Tax=Variovorax guangxiensis TaxID=1775474 RepID=A0A840G1Q8_9BURK|nr:phage virion morphogenesis protein [Variovorax guangxiensis]MBB4225519.1 phage virion morphogenesis protein [Variovorax guangxiensis]
MADALSRLANWAAPLVAGLSSARRRAAMVQVSTYLRRSQAERIGAQLNPDGTPYEPRKPRKQLRNKKGAIRRKMFEKLRTAKYLRKAATAESATITIGGRTARIARVHQRGLRDKVDWRKPNSPTVQYPKRELLGFTPADEDAVTDILLHHVTANG